MPRRKDKQDEPKKGWFITSKGMYNEEIIEVTLIDRGDSWGVEGVRYGGCLKANINTQLLFDDEEQAYRTHYESLWCTKENLLSTLRRVISKCSKAKSVMEGGSNE